MNIKILKIIKIMREKELKKNNKNNEDNYIITEIKIKENDLNKEIRILNSC